VGGQFDKGCFLSFLIIKKKVCFNKIFATAYIFFDDHQIPEGVVIINGFKIEEEGKGEYDKNRNLCNVQQQQQQMQ